MHCRLGTLLIASALITSGCAQTVRHTNTLLFATNTQIALSAGTSATAQPDITLGYKRQEAVVMPLVANYAPYPHEPGKLVPCASATSVLADCLIVGKNEKTGSHDSYSVLASFGAKFSGLTGGTKPEANVGIAQYFATGVAAQLLALTGGASIVSTAAPEAMTPSTAAAVAAVMNPEDAQRAVLGVADYDKAVADGVAKGIQTLGLIMQTRICLKDSTTGPKLREALAADSRTKDDAKTIIEAGSASQKDLTDYFLIVDPAVEKAIAEIVALKC